MLVRGYFRVLANLMVQFKTHNTKLKVIYDEYQAALPKSSSTYIYSGTLETFRQDLIKHEVNVYFVWNIDQWSNINTNGQFVEEEVPLGSIYSLLPLGTIQNIDQQKSLNLPGNIIDDPVLVVPWGLNGNNYLLIDGHHRIFRKNHRGDSDVKVYFLNEDQSIDMMMNELYKNLYRIFISITRLQEYLNGTRNDCPIYRFNQGNPSRSYKQNYV